MIFFYFGNFLLTSSIFRCFDFCWSWHIKSMQLLFLLFSSIGKLINCSSPCRLSFGELFILLLHKFMIFLEDFKSLCFFFGFKFSFEKFLMIRIDIEKDKILKIINFYLEVGPFFIDLCSFQSTHCNAYTNEGNNEFHFHFFLRLLTIHLKNKIENEMKKSKILTSYNELSW